MESGVERKKKEDERKQKMARKTNKWIYPCLLPRQFQIYFLLFQKLQDEDHAKTTCYRGYPIEANSDIYLQIYFSQIASK